VRQVSSIIEVQIEDYENRTAVYLINNGNGPAIIDLVLCIDENDKSDSLLPLMPNISGTWTTFTEGEGLRGKSLAVGQTKYLILLDNPSVNDLRALRAKLSTITVKVFYHDIYRNEFQKERSLSYFGRSE